MKKIFAMILSAALLLTSCGRAAEESIVTDNSDDTLATTTLISMDTASHEAETSTVSTTAFQVQHESVQVENLGFTSLNDPNLLQYINDTVYSHLEQNFANDDWVIANVSCVYKSKEYLDNLAFNSKENVYFGYTLSELEDQFEGKKFVFTVNDAGETTYKEFEAYDDTYDKVVRNVAIGTGVILICVTVSVATGGTASVILAASAKTAATMALSSGAISGISQALITGIQTKDFDQTVKAAALKASEGFMWGAITGAVAGGVSEAFKAKTAAASSGVIKDIPSPRESELFALEQYGGSEQVTYLAGQEVPWGTAGGTRPDVVRQIGNQLEAIEVKNYDLQNNIGGLCSELKRQISQRVTDLPPDSLQRIALDVRGRGYTAEIIENAQNAIWSTLSEVYPNIPIDILV